MGYEGGQPRAIHLVALTRRCGHCWRELAAHLARAATISRFDFSDIKKHSIRDVAGGMKYGGIGGLLPLCRKGEGAVPLPAAALDPKRPTPAGRTERSRASPTRSAWSAGHGRIKKPDLDESERTSPWDTVRECVCRTDVRKSPGLVCHFIVSASVSAHATIFNDSRRSYSELRRARRPPSAHRAGKQRSGFVPELPRSRGTVGLTTRDRGSAS